MAAVAVARVGVALLSSDVRNAVLAAAGALFLGAVAIVFVIVALMKSLLGFAASGVYFWPLAVVFVTSTGMSVLNWSGDAYLLVLGTLAFASARLGRTARRRRWPGWTTADIVGMSASYVVLLTAFYVENGPRLPLWKELPPIAFWIGPTFIGAPIIARALWRHTRVRRHLRLLAQSLRGPVPTPRGSI
jgi:hypothetical protein